MKKSKSDLRKDNVTSNTFHVGIELELCAPDSDGHSRHDDDACYQSRYEMVQENLESLSNANILRDYMAFSREEACQVESYFDSEAWIRDYMSNWSDDGCDDSECCYRSPGAREALEESLRELTGNKSFKVVADGSINCNSDQTDAEVCWNYFASKETIKDNARILKHLSVNGCSFDKSCGLHINLNNYLQLNALNSLPTAALSFLFNFVAPSRSKNTFCNKYAISKEEKYSMLYEQGDRVEFRFFSPTLEADKLNHYVVLANTVYKRLAGKACKLPKKTAEYFLKKMVEVNTVPAPIAQASIDMVNTLKPYAELAAQYANYSVEETEAA